MPVNENGDRSSKLKCGSPEIRSSNFFSQEFLSFESILGPAMDSNFRRSLQLSFLLARTPVPITIARRSGLDDQELVNWRSRFVWGPRRKGTRCSLTTPHSVEECCAFLGSRTSTL